jgi:hypothetical protein
MDEHSQNDDDASWSLTWGHERFSPVLPAEMLDERPLRPRGQSVLAGLGLLVLFLLIVLAGTGGYVWNQNKEREANIRADTVDLYNRFVQHQRDLVAQWNKCLKSPKAERMEILENARLSLSSIDTTRQSNAPPKLVNAVEGYKIAVGSVIADVKQALNDKKRPPYEIITEGWNSIDKKAHEVIAVGESVVRNTPGLEIRRPDMRGGDPRVPQPGSREAALQQQFVKLANDFRKSILEYEKQVGAEELLNLGGPLTAKQRLSAIGLAREAVEKFTPPMSQKVARKLESQQNDQSADEADRGLNLVPVTLACYRFKEAALVFLDYHERRLQAGEGGDEVGDELYAQSVEAATEASKLLDELFEKTPGLVRVPD